MPSHVDAMAATTGHNIRGDRGVRDKLENASSSVSDAAKEWPELIGLEVPRQVRFRSSALMVTTLIILHIHAMPLESAGKTERNARCRNEDQRWCRTDARRPNQGQYSSPLLTAYTEYTFHLSAIPSETSRVSARCCPSQDSGNSSEDRITSSFVQRHYLN